MYTLNDITDMYISKKKQSAYRVWYYLQFQVSNGFLVDKGWLLLYCYFTGVLEESRELNIHV